jgi:hypothetical protein
MGSSSSSGTSAALSQSKAAYDKYSRAYDDYRNQADAAFANDYGGGGKEFLARQQKSGIEQANKQLASAAKGQAVQSQAAGRAASLGKGQAAMNALGGTNQLYQNNFVNAANQGAEQYRNAANDVQTRHTNLMGNAAAASTQATGQTAQIGANQMSPYEKNWGVVSGVGGIVSGIGGLVGSDIRMKDIGEIDYRPYMARLQALRSQDGGK